MTPKNIPIDIDTHALILCAGSGTRTGLGYNKILHYIGSKTILEMTLDRFFESNITSVMLVVSKEDESDIKSLITPYKNIQICIGGATRAESVKNGLKAIKNCDIVVIHDAARPYIKPEIINQSIESAVTFGSGITAIPAIDTIKKVKNNQIEQSLNRSELYQIQTPQSFKFEQILKAYSQTNESYTDDSEYYFQAGFTPRIVPGDPENIKITTPFDLFHPMATNKPVIGTGFDVHQLVENRLLILGGVNIPHSKGLLGHSDADVLTHAIMDALLSAAHFPDIGNLFPDTDPRYKNASSIILLQEVAQKIYAQNYKIGNISAVIMAQTPKLSPFVQEMTQTLAKALNISPTQITISCTTTEHLGIIGESKGIASSATCLLTMHN